MKFRSAFFLGCCFLGLSLHAEESPLGFRAVAFQVANGLQELSFFSKEGDVAKLVLPRANFSSPQCAASSTVTFYPPLLPEQQKNLPLPAAVGVFPAGARDALFVFMPNDQPQPAYKVLAFDSSPQKVPPGATVFVNLTGRDIAGRIGSRDLHIAPAGQLIFKIPNGPARLREDAAFSVKTERGWDLFSSSRWTLDRRFRTFVFIFDSPAAKTPQMRGVLIES